MPVKVLRPDVTVETWLEEMIPMQMVFMGGYKFWIMGKDNIVHYEPIEYAKMFLTPTTL